MLNHMLRYKARCALSSAEGGIRRTVAGCTLNNIYYHYKLEFYGVECSRVHMFTNTKTCDVAWGMCVNINTDWDILHADTANYSSVAEMDCLMLSG